MQDLLAEAMAEGLSVQGALNALSLGAVRLYLRNDIGNPFVRATASVFFVKVGSLVGQSPSLHAERKSDLSLGRALPDGRCEPARDVRGERADAAQGPLHPAVGLRIRSHPAL